MSRDEDRPLLRLETLTAGYARPVVGPVSFSLRRGEILGLWGPNGTGKSTILKAIGQAARIFAGRIEQAPGTGIAYLDQQPPRLPAMPITGRELLEAARLPTAARPAGLAAILDRRIDRISGGQYQLLWIWSALAAEADLVLLDEPTNNLDPGNQAALIEILAAQRQERAVLLVSHERDFLASVCSRVAELDQGRLEDV